MRPVVWSESARSDYLAIVAFIGEDNPIAAEDVGERIARAAKELSALATGHQGRVAGTYERVVTDLPYIVAYAIEARRGGGERIVIARVIHTSRNWPEGAWPR